MTDNLLDDLGELKEFQSTFGGIFKPQEHANAVAIVFRPTEYREGGSRFNYEKGPKAGQPKDQIVADFHIFKDLGDVKDGKPSQVMEGAINESTVIIKTGQAMLAKGKTVIVRLDNVRPAGGGNKYWDFTTAESDVAAKVAEYWRGVKAAEQAAGDEIDALLNA